MSRTHGPIREPLLTDQHSHRYAQGMSGQEPLLCGAVVPRRDGAVLSHSQALGWARAWGRLRGTREEQGAGGLGV